MAKGKTETKGNGKGKETKTVKAETVSTVQPSKSMVFGLTVTSPQHYQTKLATGKAVDFTRQGRRWIATCGEKSQSYLNLNTAKYAVFTKAVFGKVSDESMRHYEAAMTRTTNPALIDIRENGIPALDADTKGNGK